MERLPPFLRFNCSFNNRLFTKWPNTFIERHGLIENSVASMSTMIDQALLRHDLGKFEGANIRASCSWHKLLHACGIFKRDFGTIKGRFHVIVFVLAPIRDWPGEDLITRWVLSSIALGTHSVSFQHIVSRIEPLLWLSILLHLFPLE